MSTPPHARDAVDRPEPPAAGDAPTGNEPRAAPAEGWLTPRASSALKRLGTALGAVGAIIGALVGLTSLVDWVTTKVDEPVPATIAPSIERVEPQDPQLLGDFLTDTGEPREGLTREQLAQQGFVFAVTMRIRGERGKLVSLRWFMFDAGRGERLRGASFNQVPAIFRPRNDDQTRTHPVWVPHPPRAGRYRVTFVLANQQGEPIAQKPTAPFDFRPPRS